MGQHQLQEICVRLRRRIGTVALVGATIVGGTSLAVAPVAAAAPSPATVGAARTVAKDDGLAPVAVQALGDLQTYIRTGDSSTLERYVPVRNAIADEVAARLELDPAAMETAWAKADLPHQVALMAAFTQLGVPYRRNTSKEGIGFDCSGLTTYVWGVAGYALTRQSGAQIKAAAKRTVDNAMAGDLIYYPGHVMLYLGIDRAIVHAPYTGRTVEVDMLSKRRSTRLGDPTA